MTRPGRRVQYILLRRRGDELFRGNQGLTNAVPFLPAIYTNGTGPGSYPYGCTVTNLSNNMTYCFAIRAERQRFATP